MGGALRVSRDTASADILDGGPKAAGWFVAKLVSMNRPPLKNVRSPRRFLLLPQESVDGPGNGPRIRRYQLSSVGRRPGVNGVDVAKVRIAREVDRLSS